VVLISDGHGGDEGPTLRDPALGLSAFRSRLYGCFGQRADALFELTDAILTTNTNPSLVHLSLASVHRRGWGSLYAALNKGRIGAGVLRNLLARVRFADDPESISFVSWLQDFRRAGNTTVRQALIIRNEQVSGSSPLVDSSFCADLQGIRRSTPKLRMESDPLYCNRYCNAASKARVFLFCRGG